MVTVTSAVPVVPSTVKSIPMMPAPAPIPTLVVAMSPPPPPAVLAVAIIPIIASGLHKTGGLWNMGNAGTQRRGTCRHACERQCQRGRCACNENMRLHMPLLFMSSVVLSAHDRDNQSSTEPRVNRSFTSSSCARPLEDVRGLGPAATVRANSFAGVLTPCCEMKRRERSSGRVVDDS